MFLKLMQKMWMLISVSILFACSPHSGDTLQVGTNKWIGYEPLYFAQDAGYFDTSGIKVVELASASQVAKAFEQGIIDIAALTLDEAIRLACRNDDYVILWVLDYSFGGDAVIAQQGINSFSELRGKKVGLEDGAVGKYLLSRAAEKSGLDIQDIDLVPIHVNQQESEFKQGNVDAVATFEPVKSHLLADGAIELFSSRDIPGEIVDVLVTRKTHESTYKQQLKLLIDGWEKAARKVTGGDEAALQLLASRSNLSVPQIQDMLRNIRIPQRQEVQEMLYGNLPSLIAQIEQVSHFLLQHQEIKKTIQGSSLIPREQH